MIANERQHAITKDWIERFEQDLAALDQPSSSTDPTMDHLVKDGIKSQLEDLRE